MVVDMYMELFDVCRNACIPDKKLIGAMESLHRKKAITTTKQEELEEWFHEVGAVAFIFINFNHTLNSLLRL